MKYGKQIFVSNFIRFDYEDDEAAEEENDQTVPACHWVGMTTVSLDVIGVHDAKESKKIETTVVRPRGKISKDTKYDTQCSEKQKAEPN